MKEVYVVNCCRTAIGSFGGSLKDTPATELGAVVVKEALSRAGIAGALVDEVILGEVRQSTEASNIARCALLEAGLPERLKALRLPEWITLWQAHEPKPGARLI